jgi:hypothetical protein
MRFSRALLSVVVRTDYRKNRHHFVFVILEPSEMKKASSKEAPNESTRAGTSVCSDSRSDDSDSDGEGTDTSTKRRRINDGSGGQPEVKLKEKNKEHARNTRLRKKNFIDQLKSTIQQLGQERDEDELRLRNELSRIAADVRCISITSTI